MTSVPQFSAHTAPHRNPFRWRPDQQWEAYLFILPSLLGFLVFVFLAVGTSFGISFLDWGLTGPRGFVAANNYRQLLRDRFLDRISQHRVLHPCHRAAAGSRSGWRSPWR